METMFPQQEEPMGEFPELIQGEDMPDGSAVFDLMNPNEMPQQQQPEQSHFENLALHMDDTRLSGIGADLIEGIKQDLESRSDWEQSATKIMKYLGFKVEEYRDVPFMRACSAYDTTLSSCLLNSYSVARAELFPNSGPAKTEIVGLQTPDREQSAERVEDFINYYLTQIDKIYYNDSERMLMYVILFGCAFRKVYLDPISNMPIARHIPPQDLIIDNNTTSLLGSSRITHVMFLNKKEIILRQLNGIFKDTKLPDINDEDEDDDMGGLRKTIDRMDGVNKDSNENKTLFKFYEVHADLNLESEKNNKQELPLPYVVTMCATSKKVLSIRRNWKEGDDTFKKIQFFVQYSYLPGFGIYSLGLGQLLGSNAITLTAVQRMQIDAGTLKNFPGGLMAKGLKVESNDKAIGPCEFRQIETGGLPIDQVVTMMPYQEPSTVLGALRAELKDECFKLVGAAEAQVSENRADIPVGTMLASIEVATRLQSSILRSLHMSLGEELTMLYNLFAEHMPEEAFMFAMPNKDSQIWKMDFNPNVGIYPVSDPNLTTSTHRILRAEALLKLAQSNPQIHNLWEAYHRMYVAMNVQDIDKILPPPEQPMPLDPVTENMNMMQGKAAKAELWQDHQAHMMVHQLLMQDPNSAPIAQAHVREHQAMQFLIEMQQAMGIPQMPDIQQLQNPEVQNQIAMMAAQAAKEMLDKQQAEAESNKPMDPNMLLMADIQQKQQANQLKHEDSQLRAETEAFKAQLKFESEKAKLEGQQDMAVDKNQTDITIEQMKQSGKVLDVPHGT